jgi:tRNA (cytidine/uridine-2'-O-)-methyltransferase
MLHIVLYQPEIPHNTGAIGRLCLATGARLHLIEPLGFSLEDKHLRRAGLDYWAEVDVQRWPDYESLTATASPSARFFYLTTKATKPYWQAPLASTCPGAWDTYLVFGRETRGLPASLLDSQAEHCFTIPMLDTRSLNLATAVAIVLYEAVRQSGGIQAKL